MIKKENLDKTNAWPFVEAKKMLRERKSLIEKKGKNYSANRIWS
jgi:lysyl-tRNA synthetase class 1